MIRNFLKGIYQARRDKTIAQYYELFNSFSSLTPEANSEIPKRKNLLVLAPHCDDETVGCGGTLYKYHSSGSQVTVVFLTDGSMCGYSGNPKEIIVLRRQEARAAGNILGIENFIFLDSVDRRLRKTTKIVSQLSQILSEVKPDMVFLPFFLDNHPDHRVTASIFADATKSFTEVPVFFYEIWSALIPNQLIDISDVIDKKVEALRCYKSQESIDCVTEQVKSLNRFRALSLQNGWKFAEGYFKISSLNLDTFLS